jgi:hypothetical protein
MKTNKGIEPVQVFAGTSWQAGMVKSLIENEGIQAFFKDEMVGTLSPWWTSPGGVGSVKVMVSNLDFERAKLIAESYEANMQEDNSTPDNG